MYAKMRLSIFAILLAGAHGLPLEGRDGYNSTRCRCVPGDSCWPSTTKWNDFDQLLGGDRLIKTSPIAESCYDGPNKDLEKCAYVTKMWTDQDFQTANPIGRSLPYNITCAFVDYATDQIPTTCLMGQSPTYAVNVTSRNHIAETLRFAQTNNLRIAIASTGHDMLGRSDGYGSLEIWLRYFRTNIEFQQMFQSKTGNCSASQTLWNGSAIRIDGAYQWRDVHTVAKENNVIVVSGGSVSPGAIGGWPSGGGHGPATRNYGLGADQILEAEVMLADGTIVIANHCQYTDLFRALRGGGPGYGVVLGTTIKAHPNVDVVTAHQLNIAPYTTTPENAPLLDAVTTLIQHLDGLNAAGYAGYGYWYRALKEVFINNATSGYKHTLWAIGKDKPTAQAAMSPVLSSLSRFSADLFINETYNVYDDYWAFYDNESGQYDPAGNSWALTSRMVPASNIEDFSTVRDTVEIISGKPEEYASNVLLLVSGGQVYADAQDTTSGLHPAWRSSPFVLASWRNPADNATNTERQAINDDITYTKGAALKELAPGTGSYMNEGDRNDPDYREAFYGGNYGGHLEAKMRYDPQGVFFCPSCVGAEMWVDRPDGALCRV